jgi:hypothetical protein
MKEKSACLSTTIAGLHQTVAYLHAMCQNASVGNLRMSFVQLTMVKPLYWSVFTGFLGINVKLKIFNKQHT